MYNNNRKGKLKLIKELIVEFGLNDGKYWQALSNHYFTKLKLLINNKSSIFEHFPFGHTMKIFNKHSLVNKIFKLNDVGNKYDSSSSSSSCSSSSSARNQFKHRKLIHKI
ncbi:hypothetical protein M0812_21462 [Anaeramoeba flamelloides]|uniref:Uncharacterized protein n=1 Tax=Anaeramoeba flamelloides TaxID=1746091 RepID=A0AAV7YV24_9EUKA|nr:hypothetical protein M0812_21462 [Anaeramoeba flamelloides]